MRHLTLAALALGVAAAASLAADVQPLPFKITTKRADDRVAVKVENGKETISIHSPFGISQAVIEPSQEAWPEAVVLRLYLRGLENFKVNNSRVKVEGAFSLHEGKPLIRQWKDGGLDISRENSYWIEAKAFDGENPAIELPLKYGYFELTIPRALLQESRRITVDWIDFYRG